jgi:hypothetical protein
VFDWLFEGRSSVYLLLGLLVIGCVAMWWRDRKRHWFIPLAVVLALIGLYHLLDRLVETVNEQISRKLTEMAVSVKSGDRAKILEHISDKFKWEGLDKPGFRALIERVQTGSYVTELVLWDIKFNEARKPSSAKVEFYVKPKGRVPGADGHFRCVGDFVLEGNDQWRLMGFEIYNPFIDANKPLTARPYLP